MKTTTSITVDADKLAELRKEGVIISKWVNDKLAEHIAHKYPKGTLSEVKYPLTPQEAKILYETMLAKEHAEKQANEEAELKALERQKRVAVIHERLNYLTDEKMKATNPIAVDIISDEQKELHRELDQIQKELKR